MSLTPLAGKLLTEFEPGWVRCDAAENSFGHAADASKLVHKYCWVAVRGPDILRCPDHRGRVMVRSSHYFHALKSVMRAKPDHGTLVCGSTFHFSSLLRTLPDDWLNANRAAPACLASSARSSGVRLSASAVPESGTAAHHDSRFPRGIDNGAASRSTVYNLALRRQLRDARSG